MALRELLGEGFRFLATLAAMALGAPVLAQIGFNCDLDTPFSAVLGGGVPSSTYAAAGVAGFWNSVEAEGGQPMQLRDLAGNLTSVTLTGPLGGTGSGHNIPGLTGNFRALMADARGLNSPGDTYTLTGLSNGTYNVYVYACRPNGGTTNAAVYVSNSLVPNPQYVTGPLPSNTFAEGITHSIHRADVLDGTISIRVEVGAQSTYLNGFQIVAVPEPASLASLAFGSIYLILKRKKR